jgi:hypothetical protein
MNNIQDTSCFFCPKVLQEEFELLACGKAICHECKNSRNLNIKNNLLDCKQCDQAHLANSQIFENSTKNLSHFSDRKPSFKTSDYDLCDIHGLAEATLCLDFSCDKKCPRCILCFTNYHEKCSKELTIQCENLPAKVDFSIHNSNFQEKLKLFENLVQSRLQDLCMLTQKAIKVFLQPIESKIRDLPFIDVLFFEESMNELTSAFDPVLNKIIVKEKNQQIIFEKMEQLHLSLMSILDIAILGISQSVSGISDSNITRTYCQSRSILSIKDFCPPAPSSTMINQGPKKGSLLFTMANQSQNLPLLLSTMDKILIDKKPISVIEKEFEQDIRKKRSTTLLNSSSFIKDVVVKDVKGNLLIDKFGPDFQMLIEFVDNEDSIVSEKTKRFFRDVSFVSIKKKDHPDVFKRNGVSSTPVFVLQAAVKGKFTQKLMVKYSHGLVLNILNQHPK